MKSFNDAIPKIEKIINYTFRDKSLLRQAFTRSSYCNEVKSSTPVQSNEVLEFFGDSVLSLSIVTFLIKERSQRYENGIKTQMREGDFSNIRSKLSDKTNLSKTISRLQLQQYLIMGEGDSKQGIGNEPSVMEDLFESLVGAIYIDSDHSIDAVMSSLEAMLDLEEYMRGAAAPLQSYKNVLQEWCADPARRLPPPVYEIIGESGPDHNKTYICACYINGALMGEGSGRNKKLAETAAAKAALEKLK